MINLPISYLEVKSYGYSCAVHFRIFICLAVLLTPIWAIGQNDHSYEETSVTLNVFKIGSAEIPALIYKEAAYLPVKDLFEFIKIKSIQSLSLDTISGFFINPKAAFLVDKTSNQITYLSKVFKLKEDELIRTESNLYLKSNYFGQIFGLDCEFSFRNLSVILNAKMELPAVREMQQEQMRRNISYLKAGKVADTVIKRSFPLLRLGMIDWSLISSQQSQGANTTRVNLGMGAFVAGGEANVYLNYNSNTPFDKKQQFYRWRYVNNENKILRQVTAGRISTQSTSSILGPVNGVQFTNTPTTFRKSFGTYRLSSTTEPGWTVELYVNNIMVNYVKADASGFFTFDVPVIYGNSSIKLRFFSPYGEERTSEQNISIPFNFLPVHQFEYTVSAGIVGDEQKSKFSRINFNYGLSKRITVGAGFEYLSNITSGAKMPFINASVRLGPNGVISAEHTAGVRSKAMLNYRLPSNAQLELNYVKYEVGQTAINSNYSEERKAVFSMPIRGKKFAAFSRLSLHEITLPKVKLTTAEFLLSGAVSGISTNFTTSAVYTNSNKPSVFSNLSLTFRFLKGIRFTPQAQFSYKDHNFSTLKFETEKSLSTKGFINLVYEKNVALKTSFITLGLRYNFSFAQTSFSARQGRNYTYTDQSVRGSLMFNDNTSKVIATNQNNVGRGALLIVPFLDLNCNGKRDNNEPKAFGLNLKVNGGKIERNNKDTSIGIVGLEAYTNYHIEIDKNSFDNIAWHIRKAVISVDVEPNMFKQIEVPIAVVGEVSGTVYLKNNNGSKGIGRMFINIYDRSNRVVARTLTERDGYFNYIGLAPGSYTAKIDSAQLIKLNLTASKDVQFKINSNVHGDVVDGLELLIENLGSEDNALL